MEYNNFEDLLRQYGYEGIIGNIEYYASLATTFARDNNVDSCMEFLDILYYSKREAQEYTYAVITENYGAKELLVCKIKRNLLNDKIINNIINDDEFEQLIKLDILIDEYQNNLLDYYNKITNKRAI